LQAKCGVQGVTSGSPINENMFQILVQGTSLSGLGRPLKTEVTEDYPLELCTLAHSREYLCLCPCNSGTTPRV